MEAAPFYYLGEGGLANGRDAGLSSKEMDWAARIMGAGAYGARFGLGGSCVDFFHLLFQFGDAAGASGVLAGEKCRRT